MKKIMMVMVMVIAMIISIPPSLAVDVDGIKSPGEWNDNWAYGQTHVGVPTFPYGDRLEMVQGGLVYPPTGVFRVEDPADDSGPDFDESMAPPDGAPYSGLDIKRFYAQYDLENDIMYGMVTVYGIPGDLDGDGDIGEDCTIIGDCIGAVGPTGQTGIGPAEIIRVQFSLDSDWVLIEIENNDWVASNTITIPHDNINVDWDDSANGVYEMSISDFSTFFPTLEPGSEPVVVEMYAGGRDDGPGEDTATGYVKIPPARLGDLVWKDLDCDGIQDGNEPGISGVKVNLEWQGAQIATTTTNANGYYYFNNLWPLCYDIVLDPSNFAVGGPLHSSKVTGPSPANVGGNDAIDSDGINNRINNVCLDWGEEDLTNDFGFCLPSVPVLSPFGLVMLSGLLGIMAIFGIRLKR